MPFPNCVWSESSSRLWQSSAHRNLGFSIMFAPCLHTSSQESNDGSLSPATSMGSRYDNIPTKREVVSPVAFDVLDLKLST